MRGDAWGTRRPGSREAAGVAFRDACRERSGLIPASWRFRTSQTGDFEHILDVTAGVVIVVPDFS